MAALPRRRIGVGANIHSPPCVMPKAVALAVGEMPLSLPAPICHNLASPKPASMEMITTEDYILYGFLAFIALLLVSIVVGMFRQFRDTGEIKGRLSGLERQLAEQSGRITEQSGRIDSLSGRLERLEQTVASLAGEVGELKGLLLALHQRVDLVMRHRHNADTGQVILTPEAVAAD